MQMIVFAQQSMTSYLHSIMTLSLGAELHAIKFSRTKKLQKNTTKYAPVSVV